MDESKNNQDKRQFLPPMAELIDRMTVTQIKLALLKDNKDSFIEELGKLEHDIELIIDSNSLKFDSRLLRIIIVLSQMNLHIWHNESNYRNGIKDGNNLELTHGLNGIRNTAKNKIQEIVGGRKDYKIDCLAADFKDWEISW